MASVFRRFDAKYWFAAYRGADGRRVKVSTKSEDKKEAKRIADRLELEARETRETERPQASLNGVNDAMQRATQLAVAGRLNVVAARELMNDLLVATGQAPITSFTNRAWCDAWLKQKAGTIRGSSQKKYDQLCREWLAFLKTDADRAIDLITKTNAVEFRNSLISAGLWPATVNHTVKILRGIYRQAVKDGYLGRNPFEGLDALRIESNEAKRQPFTRNEVADLIEVADGDWKGLIILAASTGLRLMDAVRLQWRDVDLTENVIRTRTAKTGRILSLPIHASFLTWLRKQPRGIGAAQVFPSLANKAGPGKSGLSMGFSRLMKRANVPAGVARKRVQEDGRGRTTSQRSFHSLRHFAATQLAAAGIRAEVARQITGHTDPEMHAGYIKADVRALRAAVRRIRLSA